MISDQCLSFPDVQEAPAHFPRSQPNESSIYNMSGFTVLLTMVGVLTLVIRLVLPLLPSLLPRIVIMIMIILNGNTNKALVTLPNKTNIAPQNRPSQKETSHSLPTIHFQVLCWFQGAYPSLHVTVRSRLSTNSAESL